MDKREIRRVHGTFTPEQRQRWLHAVAEEEAARPDNLARLERRRAAMAEQSISGELRRAIAGCGLRLHDLARRSDVPAAALSDFMAGDAPLDTDQVSRIAAVLDCHLAPSARVADAR